MNENPHSFLGHLIERARAPSARIAPELVRRRPSLFEPRNGGAGVATLVSNGTAVASPRHADATLAAESIVPNERNESIAGSAAAQTGAARQITSQPSAESATAVMDRPKEVSHGVISKSRASSPSRDDIDVMRRESKVADGTLTRNTQPADKLPRFARPNDNEWTANVNDSAVGNASISTHAHTTLESSRPTAALTPRDIERVVREIREPTVPPPAPRIVSSNCQSATLAHSSRATALAPIQNAPPPAPVHVSIGRIEIRGSEAATASVPRHLAPAPRVALDEYLRQRHRSES